MATTKEMTHSAYFAALKAAAEPADMQELVLGAAPVSGDALNEAHEATLAAAEEAGDNKDFTPAAEAFRKDAALTWGLDDNRMIENVSTQALYYGTLTGFDVLMENYATVWAMWAHMLPKLKSRDRARLQDFARFRRSFELGVREREESDPQLNAAAGMLAPTFDKMGALNVKALNDKKADITADTAALWDEVAKLIGEIEATVAR
ncbi:MAG: hypothetical protein HY260_20740 [Chloroflexi bacterium]|nr:hypothetical protein [Chloroflexota bacterium]